MTNQPKVTILITVTSTVVII